MRACTHSGSFHADEVFATAILQLLFDDITVTRSREPQVIEAADIVYDVGGIYDAERLRFDHHMADFPKREDGRPFSSVGLIWERFGTATLAKAFPVSIPIRDLLQIAQAIDEELVLPIDMIDNGRTEPTATDITTVVDHFNPNWTEGASDAKTEEAFFQAVDFARGVLSRLFAVKFAEYRAESEIHEAAMRSEDPRIIVLDRNVPFRSAVHRLGLNELLYVISPSGNKGNWGVTAVSVAPNSFVNRKDLPGAWAGLSDGELQAKSGVSDAIFAHRSRFFAVAMSRGGATRLAEIALSSE